LPGLPGGACVLPRTQLLFTRLNLSDIPLRQRREAALLELEQQAPFGQLKGWALWQEGQAGIWYWPQSLEEQALLAPAPGLVQPSPMPETALWPPLAPGSYRWVEEPESKLYLIQYQHPSQGLYEKRYRRPLGSREASAWLQRHGWQGDDTEPNHLNPALPPRLQDTAGPQGESLTPGASALERRYIPALAAVLVFMLLVYLLAWGRAWWAAQEAREAQIALQAQVEDVIQMRNHASRLRAQNLQLAAMRQPSQLHLAATLAQALGVENTRLVGWNYRSGALEISWLVADETTAPDATEIIRQLEALPAFSNVQAQLKGALIEVSLTINPTALAENPLIAPEKAPALTVNRAKGGR